MDSWLDVLRVMPSRFLLPKIPEFSGDATFCCCLTSRARDNVCWMLPTAFFCASRVCWMVMMNFSMTVNLCSIIVTELSTFLHSSAYISCIFARPASFSSTLFRSSSIS